MVWQTKLELCFLLLKQGCSLSFSGVFFSIIWQRKDRKVNKEMVDDFMVCVDRIIASACFQSVNEGVVRTERVEVGENFSVPLRKNGEGCSKKPEGKMIECRICQEEDQESAMEAPCACNGTLKFAHRKCIQRWCNKKGDITCEICNQVYAPNYSLPPATVNPDGMTIDIRQALGPQLDLHGPHFLALAAAEHQLLRSEYDDYAVGNNGGMGYLRFIALVLMLVLLMRHALMFASETRMVNETSDFVNVSLLQFAGFLLPCFVVARTLYIVQCRRRRQG